MRFYLGSYRNHWLWEPAFADVALFISHITLRRRIRPFPRAVCRTWALDSGGFSELNRHHVFVTTSREYVDAVRRYVDELGNLLWAAPQDWMCEPWMIEKTGLDLHEHQRRTVENFIELTTLAPDLPFVPVVQGWHLRDYVRCVELYAREGVDLTAHALVGVGSVCRRQSTGEAGAIFAELSQLGIACHGFGVKTGGIRKYARHLRSADSTSWSMRARRNQIRLPDCAHRGDCRNCPRFALQWRTRLVASLELSLLDSDVEQLALFDLPAVTGVAS